MTQCIAKVSPSCDRCIDRHTCDKWLERSKVSTGGYGRTCVRCGTGLDAGQIMQGQGVVSCEDCDDGVIEGWPHTKGNPHWMPSMAALEAAGLAH